ncbi:hypothetical protein E2C01_014981 [Portunus trituberculatus]|uniref:Uncharacterized protein n=1 Tax=Portunus trituberculatus TaxID=210409 RepID=A0A5B7DLH4_PORTR|nr:hypothetical protein [Portunus trituberculatus]
MKTIAKVLASGDHMSSIEMVVSKKAEVAVVDSLSLSNYLTRHYYQEPELHLQVSWGPLPPHPIIFNTKLPDIPPNILPHPLFRRRILLCHCYLLAHLLHALEQSYQCRHAARSQQRILVPVKCDLHGWLDGTLSSLEARHQGSHSVSLIDRQTTLEEASMSLRVDQSEREVWCCGEGDERFPRHHFFLCALIVTVLGPPQTQPLQV